MHAVKILHYYAFSFLSLLKQNNIQNLSLDDNNPEEVPPEMNNNDPKYDNFKDFQFNQIFLKSDKSKVINEKFDMKSSAAMNDNSSTIINEKSKKNLKPTTDPNLKIKKLCFMYQ